MVCSIQRRYRKKALGYGLLIVVVMDDCLVVLKSRLGFFIGLIIFI